MFPIRSALRSFVVVACALSMAACGGSDNDPVAGNPPGGNGPGDGSGNGGGGVVSHAVSVAVQGTGSGDVESLDAALACSTDCSADYPVGTTVKLTAIPAMGSVFDGWEGACEGTDACVVTTDDARSVVARFSLAKAAIPAGAWLRGDMHIHDDHSSDGSGPRQTQDDKAKGNVALSDQIGEATRKGLQFMPFTDHRTYDQHYDPLWESSSLLLIRGEEANGSPHALAHGAVDSIVQGASRADRKEYTRVQQSVWNAHSQGATWAVAHPDDGEMNDDDTLNVHGNVVGIDAVESWNGNPNENTERAITYAENRWNAGYRFGVVGASDSHMREFWNGYPGYGVSGPSLPTTHALTKAVNEQAVLSALQAGHTTLSLNANAPLVTLTTDLQGGGYTAMGGDEVFVPAGTSGHLRINVQRSAGMDVLVYHSPGKSAGVLKTFKPTADDQTFIVNITAGNQPEWYRAEVRGMSIPDEWEPVSVMQLKAFVSPVFISPGPVEAKADIPVPADAGVADDAVRVVGARGEFTGFPDIAVDAGAVHYVAQVFGETSSAVVYRRRDDKGAWNDAGFKLSGNGLARFPRVAARGDDVWVVWEEDTVHVPHRPVINLRHSSDGGASWKTTQTVRSLEGRAEHPDIGIAANGKPVLAWQEIQAAQPFDIMIQEIGTDKQPKNLSRAGKTIDAGQPDDSRSPRYPASVLPALTVAADGRVAVAWQDNRNDRDPLWTGAAAYGDGTTPDDWQIQVAVRNTAGAWANPVDLGATDRADRHPDAAFGTNGDLVVAWETKELKADGKNLSVVAAVSADGGATFSAPATLAPDDKTMSERPRLGADKDGAVRAVWYDSRSEDWRWRVMTAVYKKDAGWDAGTLLNAKGINTWPVTSGGFIAFASTRNATRMQRDRTQQAFLLSPK